MVCKGIEFDDLVSVGYAVGKPLRDPRLLKDWIHFSMLRFITNELENTNHCVDIDETDYIINVKKASDTYLLEDMIIYINLAHLSTRETEVIRLYFFDGNNQDEVADLLRISQQSVFVYLKRALTKLKTICIKDYTNDKSQ